MNLQEHRKRFHALLPRFKQELFLRVVEDLMLHALGSERDKFYDFQPPAVVEVEDNMFELEDQAEELGEEAELLVEEMRNKHVEVVDQVCEVIKRHLEELLKINEVP